MEKQVGVIKMLYDDAKKAKEQCLTLVPKPTPLLSSSQSLGTSSPKTATSRCCRH